MLRSIIAILIISAVPLSAVAKDVAAATACSEKLSPVAKQIFDLAAPDVTQSSPIKEVLVAKIKPLVMSGKMDRAKAQAEAPNAGKCLKLLQ